MECCDKNGVTYYRITLTKQFETAGDLVTCEFMNKGKKNKGARTDEVWPFDCNHS